MSERQLRDLIRDGIIPHVNVGRGERTCYRLRPADLEAFISQRTSTTCKKSKKSKGSTGAPKRANGSTTFNFEVIDFVALREQQLAERQKNGSRPTGGKKRPKSRKVPATPP
ncbi:helix-turn-helix domain-containing protein [Methylosinus trichosporium]|uniref:helix-turn-helix domain-containing protein n=1 Tax=Methylosinus trichosporium TaxID=426 RepID=UPI0013000243|nr:helix-turn-helix domain-containing protein [Methylosinus trichosporium]